MEWNELVAALAGLPSLPDAVCRSRAPLFDANYDKAEMPDERADRIRVAQSFCAICPDLTPCRAWATEQIGELSGVVAGELYEPDSAIGRLDGKRSGNAVVELVRSRTSTTAAEVANTLGIPHNTAAVALSRACRDGLVRRCAPGIYSGTPANTPIEASA